MKNCAKRFGEEQQYPPACPTLREESAQFLAPYQEAKTRRLAQAAAVSVPKLLMAVCMMILEML